MATSTFEQMLEKAKRKIGITPPPRTLGEKISHAVNRVYTASPKDVVEGVRSVVKNATDPDRVLDAVIAGCEKLRRKA